jgi:hypothetical protein
MEAAGTRRPRASETSLEGCYNESMLRGLLLLGATLPLVGLGAASAAHARNGRIAYVHVGNGSLFQT